MAEFAAGYPMKRFLVVISTLVGAVFGGTYPGSLIAFLLCAMFELSGFVGISIWFVLTLFFSMLGAALGCLVGRRIRSEKLKPSDSILVAVAGIVIGVIGFAIVWISMTKLDPPH